MVRFFNQKEEVINIELTPYGKEQFSKGVFSPAYYAFYDSSVIYDGEYVNITETQNQVTNRIANETPKLQPNTKFTSSAGAVYSLLTANDKDSFAQNVSSSAPFIRTLGSSDPNSVYVPSWSIRTYPLSDASLNEGVRYKMDNTIPEMSATLFIDYTTREVEGQTIYNLKESDSLILDVQELNTIFKGNGNFDIEVYRTKDDGQLNSLGFINRESDNFVRLEEQKDPFVLLNTINGNNEQILRNFPALDEKYVEFFLDIAVDGEITFDGTDTSSDLYRRNTDNTPQDPCDTLDTLPGGYDIS